MNDMSTVKECSLELTDELRQKMVRMAFEVLTNSYAPYSHYNVAAAALFSSGEIYTGANIESSLLSCTICAERNAIFHAAAMGERKLIAIVITGGLNAAEELASQGIDNVCFDEYCTPCGMCRQVMRDFADPHTMKIICARSETDCREWTLDQLLPESFGPESLED